MIKRFVPVLLFLVVLSVACVDAFFDLPSRHIEREVQVAELVGKWELTPDTESRITAFLKKYPSWRDWGLPWRIIMLNDDGTCQVVFEDLWLTEYYQEFRDHLVNGMTCKWELENAGVHLRFDYRDSYTYYYGLTIVEKNDELILWNYIGDPDNTNYQDFKRNQD